MSELPEEQDDLDVENIEVEFNEKEEYNLKNQPYKVSDEIEGYRFRYTANGYHIEILNVDRDVVMESWGKELERHEVSGRFAPVPSPWWYKSWYKVLIEVGLI